MNHALISVAQQKLWVLDPQDEIVFSSAVSTATNGINCEKDSFGTPIGQHIIRAKIGDGVPKHGIFKQRRFLGEVYTAELGASHPDRDWILSRILWLSGCEIGKNRLGNVDTMQRYIYIHGAASTRKMGVPASHGCITLHCEDMISLFDLVEVGSAIEITAD